MFNMSRAGLVSIDFEVHGKVQGVLFRKHTQNKAHSLGLRGWCTNTTQGTVKGQIQGPGYLIVDMKRWLETGGSPKSKIEMTVFNNEEPIDVYSFGGFQIRK